MPAQAKLMRLPQKQNKNKRAWKGLPQVIEYLPSMLKILSLKPSKMKRKSKKSVGGTAGGENGFQNH
jgi:hypothetical protein